MNRENAFALTFENETMKICSAGYNEHISEFVLYCKEDEIDEYDGGRSAEFVVNAETTKAFVMLFDENIGLDDILFNNDAIKVSERNVREGWTELNVFDSHDRCTPITLFKEDADTLASVFA